MADRAQLLGAVHAAIRAYCEAEHDFAFKANDPVVRLHEPTFSTDEINAAVDVLLSTWVTAGPKVRGFERAFCDSFGFGHGVVNNSGSSANLLAVAALANPVTRDRLAPGDEVIVPALSWSTTVWPLVQHGLVPVIVDIDPRTLNIDPNEVERAVGPRTRAIVPVHVYGNPCDMDALTEICRRRNLTLIEDCCEALGASYRGRAVGAFGAVGTFSFYFSHHITTLEGGICVTGDRDLAETIRALRAHGWIRELEDGKRYRDANPEIDPKFLFVNSGYNMRATELQGAMGMVQLPKLAGFVDIRRANAAAFRAALDRHAAHLSFVEETSDGYSSWFGFPITVKESAPFTVGELRAALEEARIETRPIICGNIALQPALKLYAHRVVGPLNHATRVMNAGFSFGNHQSVDAAARDYIVGRIDEFMARKG
jgi:CDP-6-deoxy-D-xylo-4-hexulose-3-dehydrase